LILLLSIFDIANMLVVS